MNATTRNTALAALEGIVGARHVLTDAALFAGALVEPRGLYRGKALALVRPGSTQEVAAIAAFCNQARIGIVPQGGNTGLVGGQTPDSSGDQIVLSTQRLKAHPRDRSAGRRDDLRGRRDACRGASRGARRRPAFSAVARGRGNLHHRRQCLDQRRRRDGDRLRQYARPRHRGRSGPGRWTGGPWPEQAAQGQHRLRREEPLHRRRGHARHRHRRVAEALPQPPRPRNRLRRARKPRTRARTASRSRASGSARA